MAFASPPGGLNEVTKKGLNKTVGKSIRNIKGTPVPTLRSDLARDILDSVVSPPECDAMWDTYQGEDGSDEGSDDLLSEADEDLAREHGMHLDDIEMG